MLNLFCSNSPYTQKGFQKHIKHEIKYCFNIIHQFNPFLQKPSTTTQFIPQIRNYEHRRYESSTTTPRNNNNINQTWIHQQSINNNSFFINLGKTQVYMYKHHKHVKFDINNLIIFKFIYPNIASKLKPEFHKLKSQ